MTAASWCLQLLLLCAADRAAAQATATAAIPYAAMVIVALVLALMGAALIVVLVVICHFAWLRKTSLRGRPARRAAAKSQQPAEQPSTVPKNSYINNPSVVDAPVKQQQQQPPSRARQPSPTIADPVSIRVDVQEPVVEAVKVPAIRSQPKRSPASASRAEMRDTASQFLEFLSRKWNMQHSSGPVSPLARPVHQQEEKQPERQPELTTFKPIKKKEASKAAATTAAAAVEPSWPQLGDAFFDVCEQDIGQYDNLTHLARHPTGEADRYEVAMELRDTRRSRASTPGLSGRYSEAESEPEQQQQQQQQQQQEQQQSRSDWVEEVSEAL